MQIRFKTNVTSKNKLRSHFYEVTHCKCDHHIPTVRPYKCLSRNCHKYTHIQTHLVPYQHWTFPDYVHILKCTKARLLSCTCGNTQKPAYRISFHSQLRKQDSCEWQSSETEWSAVRLFVSERKRHHAVTTCTVQHANRLQQQQQITTDLYTIYISTNIIRQQWFYVAMHAAQTSYKKHKPVTTCMF